MSSRILIIEDEKALADSLSYVLSREGFETTVATDGRTGLQMALDDRPDLIILDLLLPELDGLQVCQAVRRKSDVPILMLTARAEEADKVIGLGIGADDYVTKPFSTRELVARVKALLRRASQAAAARQEERIRLGDLVIDTAAREVAVRGRAVPLTPKEYSLLLALARHPGRAMSREALMQDVWGGAEYRDPHTVDVHVRWLRMKIEDDPSRPQRILTVRGFGYKMAG